MQAFQRKEIYEEKKQMEVMQGLLMKLLMTQLSTAGLISSNPHSRFQAQTKLPGFYDKWLEVSLEFLAEKQYIIQTGETFHICNEALVSQELLWNEWDRKKREWLEDSSIRAKVLLAETMLRALPDILTGSKKATDFMFPHSSMELVEGIYKHNQMADYFNNVLAHTVISYVQDQIDRKSDVKLRIVEIGAGTGGTSASVLQKLTPYHGYIQEYCYTDISKAFLMHGAKEYESSHPFLTFQMLDINKSITEQKVDMGSYDVVIAANVLHATPNIHQTLRHAKALLKRNGIIVINEITEKTLFHHLTFGLLEGWWLYEDDKLRIPGCPALCAEGWKKALTAEGFTSVSFPAIDAQELGQQIVAAKSDGLIRYKQDFSKETSTDQKRKERKPAASNQQRIASTEDQGIKAKMLDYVRNTIIQKLSESLLIDAQMIDQHESFSDYGVDSITGVKLVQAINQALHITLDTTTLFDYSSVTLLASHIIAEYNTVIMQPLSKNMVQDAKPITTPAKETKYQEDMTSQPVSIGKAESDSGIGNTRNKTDIAIIGISGRFAKSETVQELWKHLASGNDLVEEVSRWNLSKYDKQGMSDCHQGSFLDHIDRFDPLFFNISGSEAEYMDPQQRIFLEETWKALEDAGYAGAGVQGKKCGIYVGCGANDYQQLLGHNPPPQAFWGTANSIIPARIAYYLDLQGPAIAVDTACSSSLVAIHLACQGLWANETEMAIAGGVFIQSTPGIYQFTNRAGMLSPTGRCYTFDERADGFVLGEGAGVVVLKRLSDAIADRDHIYGVIRGSAINQDGTTNGITAPSSKSQERLQREVYDTFHINPQHIQMVEAHGTGTRLGDPIEYKALTRAFSNYTNEKNYCAIGSIKSNIGHLTFAAGVAGLIKILLSLQQKQIPPTLHFENGNSNINFEDSPFYVNTKLSNWSVKPNMKRCAAISSFGFSGTNAHMVIEEAPYVKKASEIKPGHVITLSARTPAQLHQQVKHLIQYCERTDQADYGNMSYTLLMGRKHCNHRLACVVHEQNELVDALKKWLETGEATGVYASVVDKKGHQEQITMKQYGNECIQKVRIETDANAYRKHLSIVASLYTQGYELEFEQLFLQNHYSRIPLPTYPFAKERYWIPEEEENQPKNDGQINKIVLEPVWQEQQIIQKKHVPTYDQHLVMLGEPFAHLQDQLAAQSNGITFIPLHSDNVRLEQRFECYAVGAFKTVQQIIQSKPKGNVLIQIVGSYQGEQQVFSGLVGLLQTARLENPKILGQMIEIEQGVSHTELFENIINEKQYPEDRHIRYEKGKRWVAGWKEREDAAKAITIPWKDQGVYLITGGAGGLGLIFAEEIVQKSKNVTLILTGRSEWKEEKTAKLQELQSLGAKVIYKQADMTKKDEVENLIRQIKEQIGSLHGIIHSAGIIQDNYILKKNTDEVLNVLSPKVAGTIYLDEATQDIPLDFFLLFSSMSGAIGNPGQADYAMGNAFMDCYAEYRNQLAHADQRKGLTYSINWPLWKDGGMHVDRETEKMLQHSTGMIGIESKTGIENIYQMFTAKKNRLVLMQGDVPKLRSYFTTKQAVKMEPAIEQAVRQIDKADLEERTQMKLKSLLGEQLKISVDQIDAFETLDQYGIDSLVIIELNQKLEGIFGECSKTIFYEYQTVQELTQYFTQQYLEQCLEWTGLAQMRKVETQISAPEQSVIKELPGQQITGKRAKESPSYVPLEQNPSDQLEPIAIIGMSGHYPQASTLQQFWHNLAQGKDCIVEIPEERWSTETFYEPNRKDAFAKGKSYCKWGGFLQDFASFDPLFFSISPREAMNMDPQERLFIQTCWEVLEDAGYTKELLASRHKGRIGVFAGITKTGFQLYGPPLWEQGEELFPYTSFSSIANRVSYLLNLRGPSMPIDTMCSSSLTAIHEACEHIRHGACEMAIAGGVNLYLHPSTYIQLCGQQMLSAQGKCKSFGQAADGFVPGEGVGAVLLKPLSKALEDGDQVHALIRATSINHGGKTNGYTVPNPVAQGELVREAMEKAGIDARTISYIEAHGTGTELGDPIEITGLQQAFSKDTQDTNFCAIGSVKSNIGHLEAAAGIAGLTKIILQMKHQQLVPSLHAQELNPNINFAKTPFTVQQKLGEWKRPVIEMNGVAQECPRIAGISSFGAGGANAHVIVEEFIPREEVQSRGSHHNHPVIIVLSAKNEERLKEQVNQLLAALQEQAYADRDLPHIAYTLQTGREAMEERLGMIVESIGELEEKLRGLCNNQANVENVYQGQVKQHKETVSIFLADEELQEAVQKWIERKKYAKILRLWVKGLHIDWNELYGEIKPRKISLPTYPFAKEPYWISPSRRGSLASTFVKTTTESSHHGKMESRTDCFVTKHWKLASVNKTKELHGTIAILTTNETKALAKRISERITNTRIMNAHEIPRQPDQAQEEWKQYAGIIDLAGCGAPDQTDMSWLFTLQHIIGLGKKEDIVLLCVTKGLEAFKNGSINIAGASRVGLYRTLQSEYSYVCSRHMDVERHLDDHVLADQIVEELFAESQDVEVCYRDGHRYRAYLDVEQAKMDWSSQKLNFSPAHVLWITGGTRGLGLLCAKHFVENYGVKQIVLTGREPLPPREAWDLYKEQQSPTAHKIRAIEQLERSGAQIQVLSIALSDEDEVRSSVEKVKRSMGPIGGVIHCAGSVDLENPAFIRKSLETINQVLEPKIQGLNVLYNSLKEEPLQFFVLFSSVSAIVPSLGAGQSDYAMANAYMDYFSEAHAHSCPIVSIQWPSWKETGMGEVKSSAYEQSGMISMTNKEGLSLLDQILANKLGPVILPAVIQSPIWKPETLMQTQKKATGVQHVQVKQETLTNEEFVDDELMKKTQAWLLALFSKEFMLDASQIDADSLFQEYGMDSILLAQIVTKMDRELKVVALDPSILLEYPTIGRLASYLIESYPDVLATLFSIKSEKTHVKPMIEHRYVAEPERSNVIDEHENKLNHTDKIAVIGIACHFPDARNAREYWANLIAGKDSIREIPKSRWDSKKLYTLNDYTEGKTKSKWGGFLDSIEDFDPDYFHISKSLAAQIDPLQRQLLEVSAEALLDAGYNEKELWNKQVGVFVGSRASNFSQKLDQSTKDTIVGTGQNFIAAHLAHVYNFKGPNMVIDTACSSSLTAIHLAVRSIQNKESELALAGGVDILLDESPYIAMSAANVLSPDGRCKTFSAEADGIGLGEGCGVIILKPLQQAIRDNNKIYGVIEGSAINNDGNTMGITTPNPEAQRELIEKAIVDANINPETISYVETHGTGTLIGDPIELKALTQVFKKHTMQKQFCGVGSVKSNIGHLMSAAGVASFIKVLLSLVHEELPATLHCEQPNPRFHFEESPFFIVQGPMKWTSKYAVLRAGISAFGLGGNNAHIIVSNEGVPRTHRVPPESINPNILFQRKRYWPEGSQDATNIEEHERNDKRTEENLAYYKPIRVKHKGE
ncbi:SDR family NAD(P)-dependent oxidoreductase [Brevibacillus laterosporus]|uniref:SDR family NAD(P)-dependent oxidoreductase n=1 Tax=Brevibacillus laterosporus TaxID=1465 RepID=UPI00264D4017|nr:SDR family NAD(P)-dependent oxidoreductase [Brevibacillus laterosporus]MDN9009025.1 SDR family NAD(P)-dependent oxidoreductase [Brevibacillus laterosporus]MDO0942478.1 SDR family NAD(P)-dependent oxidoreductase [Brevibacillus laterosporus]